MRWWQINSPRRSASEPKGVLEDVNVLRAQYNLATTGVNLLVGLRWRTVSVLNRLEQLLVQLDSTEGAPADPATDQNLRERMLRSRSRVNERYDEIVNAGMPAAQVRAYGVFRQAWGQTSIIPTLGGEIIRLVDVTDEDIVAALQFFPDPWTLRAIVDSTHESHGKRWMAMAAIDGWDFQLFETLTVHAIFDGCISALDALLVEADRSDEDVNAYLTSVRAPAAVVAAELHRNAQSIYGAAAPLSDRTMQLMTAAFKVLGAERPRSVPSADDLAQAVADAVPTSAMLYNLSCYWVHRDVSGVYASSRAFPLLERAFVAAPELRLRAMGDPTLQPLRLALPDQWSEIVGESAPAGDSSVGSTPHEI